MSSEPPAGAAAAAPAIAVRGLSKAYLVYAQPRDRLRQAIYPKLRGALARIGLRLPERRWYAEQWALRDLSFEVSRGETVAIIGRNGSGKSTLLQLVCGTLTPTTGEVVLQGRVAALLELGSGFNPEYTGRENVLLNASVLGLTREEALARMDAILAFADIGDVIDQPVKTYSSGMAMRLAFAVIAHVDADVLVIDEALAVGDALFQQKCFRWLRDFQKRGTVLFCGHDTAAVVNLCERAIWLDRGNVRMAGPAKDVAEAYGVFIARQSMGLTDDVAPTPSAAPAAAPAKVEATLLPMAGRDGFGSGAVQITHVGLSDQGGRTPTWFGGGEEVTVTLRVEAREVVPDGIAGIVLKDRLGQGVAALNSHDLPVLERLSFEPGRPSLVRIRFVLPLLAPGDYVLSCAIASGTQDRHVTHHWIHDALTVSFQRSHWNSALVTMAGGSVSAAPETVAAG